MPFGEYENMADCIAKNSDAKDPGAFCAQIHFDITGEWPSQKEAYRHPDFDKIYLQFLTHIADEEEAVNRYTSWISDLNLDETKSYGASRKEQFKWVRRHADFSLWKEDSTAKYWRVEAGFPLESMNHNVYSRDELLRSARTIKGAAVNVNHKYVLPTIDILGGEYEDDVVECVLRVPKALKCPVCSESKTVNDLIESRGIVNVSLEASCAYGTSSDGVCEGMYFTGLSLLTKQTLPGIPLTRMMPLESIMVEALQYAENTEGKGRKKKTNKIVMEVLEQEPVLPDDQGQCPEGMILNDQLGQCVKDTSCPEGQHFDEDVQKCVADKPIEPEDAAKTAVGTTPAENVGVDVLSPTIPKPSDTPSGGATTPAQIPKVTDPQPGAPSTLPGAVTPSLEPAPSPHGCAPDHHWDAEGNQCMPDTPITAEQAAIQLEISEATFNAEVAKGEASAAVSELTRWKKFANTKNVENIQFRTQLTDAQKRIREMEDRWQKSNLDKITLETKVSQLQRSLGEDIKELTADNRSFRKQIDGLKADNEELRDKYKTTLSTNLELSKRLTKAHEEYLEKASENERNKSALNKAKSISKKVIKIRA